VSTRFRITLCAKYNPEGLTLWHAWTTEASYVSSNPDRRSYVKMTYVQ